MSWIKTYSVKDNTIQETSKIGKNEKAFHVFFSTILLILAVMFNAFIIFIENRSVGGITLLATLIIMTFSTFWLFISLKMSFLSRIFAMLFFSSAFSIIVLESLLQYVNYIPSTEHQVMLYNYKRVEALNNNLEKGVSSHIRVDAKLREGDKNLFLSDVINDQTIFVEEDDGMIIFRSDENGFRNSKGAYNDFEVLLLGDSFTESTAVPDSETIHSNLIKNGYKTYNAGFGGTGLAHSLATFIEYGTSKKPKFTILNIVEGSSISRMHRELENPRLMEYYKNHSSNSLLNKKQIQNKTLRENFNKELLKSYYKLLGISIGMNESINKESLLMEYLPQITRIMELLKGHYGFVVTYTGEGVPVCADISKSRLRVESILRFIRDTAQSYDGYFAVGYFGAERYAANKWNNCEYNMIKSLTNNLDISLIDMVQEFDKANDVDKYFANNFYRKDINGHYNSAGYKIISDRIVKYLDSINTTDD